MNEVSDAALTAARENQATHLVRSALESQARELTHMLWRLERARRDLLPGPVEFWRGLSRLAFDAALSGLAASLDDGIRVIHSALASTRTAISELSDHG